MSLNTADVNSFLPCTYANHDVKKDSFTIHYSFTPLNPSRPDQWNMTEIRLASSNPSLKEGWQFLSSSFLEPLAATLQVKATLMEWDVHGRALRHKAYVGGSHLEHAVR